MKKSKSNQNINKKQKSQTSEVRRKRKSSPHLEGNNKTVKKEQVPRKSRWEESKHTGQGWTKIETSDHISAMKMEKAGDGDSLRIKDLLDDKEKIVQQLFTTVTGKALEEIIPDYLRKRPIDELQKLCLGELVKMSHDEILNLLPGNDRPLLKEQETQTDSSAGLNIIDPSEIKKLESNSDKNVENDTSKDINEGDQNEAPPEVLDEVAKDLGVSGGDAELLELEMRARAIRSLLKLKSPESLDSDSNFLGNE